MTKKSVDEIVPIIRKFKKFKLSTIPSDSTILLVGMRGSGKSVLMKQILYVLKERFDFCVGICPTPETQELFKSIIPDSYVFEKYEDEWMEYVVNQLYKITNTTPTDHILNICIIGDDLAANEKEFKKPGIKHIHKNGRHIKVFFLNLVQYAYDYTPSLRNNLNFVFCFGDSTKQQREKLYELFFGHLGTFTEFNDIFSELTKGYRCIVLDRLRGVRDPQNCVSYFEATTNIPPFILGGREQWKFHYWHYLRGKLHNLYPGFTKEMLTDWRNYIPKIRMPALELAMKLQCTGQELENKLKDIKSCVSTTNTSSNTLNRSKSGIKIVLTDEHGEAVN